MTWRDQAACRNHDPEKWFPSDQDRTTHKAGNKVRAAQQEHDAKQVCHTCPVIVECRTWALNTRQEHGIWGGLTTHERNQIHTRRTA